MIDLHSHILAGLDDGAGSLEESRELARRAVADGVSTIAATPHVRDDYPTRPEQMEAALEELRLHLAEHEIPLEVLAGGELDLHTMATLDVATLRRFTIAQNERYLLIEFPYRGWPFELAARLFELQLAGLTPILAHPERNREVQAKPERLAEPVRLGARVQLTAASVDGRFGRGARRAAERLVELGLVHLLASDAHTPDIREAGLSEAAASFEDAELARYLTVEAPAAVVAGESLPEPPAPRRRRARISWLSRRR